MQDDPNELRRQIDGLQHKINEIRAVAEADRRTQEAERQMLKSDLAESLTRHEASNKEGLARLEASNKEAVEKLRTDMERRSKETANLILFAALGTVGATAAVVALLEYAFRAT